MVDFDSRQVTHSSVPRCEVLDGQPRFVPVSLTGTKETPNRGLILFFLTEAQSDGFK